MQCQQRPGETDPSAEGRSDGRSVLYGRYRCVRDTSSRPCTLDYLFILTLIPVWPGCANIEVEGDIITQHVDIDTAGARVVPAKSAAR